MEIKIRPANKKDVTKILEIVNYEIENSTVLYDYKARSYEYQLSWLEHKEKGGFPVMVAEREGEVVGFGTFGIFRPWDAYQFSVEHSIYVSKNSRASGVGKLIMSEIINLARKGGYHTMIAGIDASNTGSLEFHRRFGFTEIGTFKEVGFKFDRWLDLVFMQLILK